MTALLAFALTFALQASPLEDARANLAAGQLDEVLFDLEGKTFTGAQQAEAADLLTTAGRKSLEKKDAVMALQFAQMALRLSASHPGALEVGAKAAHTQQLFGPAEEYTDRWVAAKKGEPAPLLFRAQLALEQAEWKKALALTDGLNVDALSAAEKTSLTQLRAKAEAELADRASATNEVKAMESRLVAAQEQATRDARASDRSTATKSVAKGADSIVLYRTAWCGYCNKASAFLKRKKVAFVEKDIEKDPDAKAELERKAAAAGFRLGGVPVIDVRGTFVRGFDQQALERLLD